MIENSSFFPSFKRNKINHLNQKIEFRTSHLKRCLQGKYKETELDVYVKMQVQLLTDASVMLPHV